MWFDCLGAWLNTRWNVSLNVCCFPSIFWFQTWGTRVYISFMFFIGFITFKLIISLCCLSVIVLLVAMALYYDQISKLTLNRESIRLNVRVVRLWSVPAFNNPSETSSLDMILMDENVLQNVYLAFVLWILVLFWKCWYFISSYHLICVLILSLGWKNTSYCKESLALQVHSYVTGRVSL